MSLSTGYNRIAGRSLERLAALSDGVFAVAMTLLVLDLHTPSAAAIHTERNLWAALLALSPRLLTYLMSFLTLGIFWIGQQTHMNHLARGDRNLGWIYLAFLFAVTLLPFTTSLLAEFIAFRTALLAYWLNVLLLGALLAFGWRYARRAGLVREDAPPDADKLILGRIAVSQALYALGAALCVFSTYLSVAVIVFIQLNYAVAPRFSRWLKY